MGNITIHDKMEQLSSYQIKDEQIVLCSLENCEESFKYKFALAKHLIKDHKVTPDDIKTGKHSFKVVENSSICQFPMSFLYKYLSSTRALRTQLKNFTFPIIFTGSYICHH